MQLSAAFSVSKGMIRDENGGYLDSQQFEGESSVDLSLRAVIAKSEEGVEILDENNKVIKGVSISRRSRVQPQETVCLISKERINVPAGYVAYVFLKNRFSQKGLLAFNTGIVDGGYCGPIGTLLTNISEKEVELNAVNGGRFFRVVFHKIDMKEKELNKVKLRNYTYESYLKFKSEELLDLPRYFQNPEKITNQIESSLNQKALNFGISKLTIIFSLVALLLVFVPTISQSLVNTFTSEGPVKKKAWNNKNQEYDNKLEKMNKEIEALRNDLDKINKKP